MNISFDQRVSVPADVLIQEVQGEAVLLNLKDGRYFGLNAVGTRMWNLLTQSPSIRSAFDVLLNEYEVEAERLQSDVEQLLAKLLDRGLLEIKPM